MWRRAIFLLLFASQSNTKVHLSADACSLDWPGGTPGNDWWGCAALFSKSLPYFRPKNFIFPSSPGPLYQNEVKCSAFDMKMTLHSHANKTHFH